MTRGVGQQRSERLPRRLGAVHVGQKSAGFAHPGVLGQRLLEACARALALAGFEQRLRQLDAGDRARVGRHRSEPQLEPLRGLRVIAARGVQPRKRSRGFAGRVDLVQLAVGVDRALGIVQLAFVQQRGLADQHGRTLRFGVREQRRLLAQELGVIGGAVLLREQRAQRLERRRVARLCAQVFFERLRSAAARFDLAQ